MPPATPTNPTTAPADHPAPPDREADGVPAILRAPIILLGAHRSGTSWMGELLRQMPDIFFHHEPRHIWTWGNGFKRDDLLTGAHAKPHIVRHIHQKFAALMAEHGGERLAEKTPSNCLRVEFIRAVFPDAKFVLITRDGRSVVRSTSEILGRGLRPHLVIERLKQEPPWRWPTYAPLAVNTLGRRMLGRRMKFWGPRPPGWKSWLKAGDPEPVVLAKQWSATVRQAWRDGHALGPDRFMSFRYEDLVRDLPGTLSRVAVFCELDPDLLIETAGRDFDPGRADRWRDELSADELEQIRPHMEPALNELGYTW